MATLSDTSPEAERVWIDVWRAMPPGRKWLIVGEAFRMAKALHAAGCRQRHPGASPAEVHGDWLVVQYGYRGLSFWEEPVMDPAVQQGLILREVLTALTRLGIPYAVGGSIASSLHGIARYT